MATKKHPKPFDPSDIRYMQIALALAERGLGTTAPNPSVGCLIVKNSHIIGQGFTGSGGRPHAETIALSYAGTDTAGATAYVTLEPCSHHGLTPPCVDALIQANISRVVIATKDPFHKVSGKGIMALKAANIEIIFGVCEAEAARLNEGFFNAQTLRRPLVTLKVATSLDGKIATKTGESKWITGEISRNYAHMLRATHDAIMVGKGTAEADNPSLTCRLSGLSDRSPIRIIVGNSISIGSNLLETANEIPVWHITSNESVNSALTSIIVDNDTDGKINLHFSLTALAERGITRLLVEGGGKLAANLLKHGLVDRLEWIQAPIIIGNDGISAIAAMELHALNDAKKFIQESQRKLGNDTLTVYHRANSTPAED